MPKNVRLNGYLEEIGLEFVEQEATPQLLMKLSALPKQIVGRVKLSP